MAEQPSSEATNETEEQPVLDDTSAEERIEELTRRLSEQISRSQYLEWQIETTRNRRIWRVGQAIARVRRRPKDILRLPKDLLRALRKSRPVPKPTGLSSSSEAKGAPDLRVPEVEWPEPGSAAAPVNRPALKVATILDPFSEMAFRYEWNQITFGPKDFRQIFEREHPDLLFVESAWHGNDDRWQYQLTGTNAPKQEFRELLGYCREKGIPTVFWNKEDPPHFEHFLDAARLFDYVFTVDGDRVSAYKEALGHDRVGVLQFGAQPRVHNPVMVPGGRGHDVVFAGMYFRDRHPKRREQMETLLAPARDFGLHIFARFQGADERYRYPDEYQPHIVGELPYERMLAAYKMYKVFLNVNSVTDSPTMCARRVFELSACSTSVLSGWSEAIENTLGDLIPIATTPEQAKVTLQCLLNSAELRERQAHRAMREVLSKHTYSHRVDEILSAVGVGTAGASRTRSVSVILPTNRPEQINHAISQVARQIHQPVQLVMVLHGIEVEPGEVTLKAKEAGLADVTVLAADSSQSLGACLNMALDAAEGDFIAKFDDDNLYGPHYLSDALLAFDYTDAGVVGKGAHYTHFEGSGATVLRFPEFEHRFIHLIQGGSIIAKADVLRRFRFIDASRSEDTTFLLRCKSEGIPIYSGDRYNFVFMRGDVNNHTWDADEAELTRNGRLAFWGRPESHVLI